MVIRIRSRDDLRYFIRYEALLFQRRRASLFGPVFKEASLIWRYIPLLRYEEYHTNVKNKIRKLVYRYCRIKLGRKIGFNIPPNVIDVGFHVWHIGPLLINAKSIGKNFTPQYGCAIVAGGHDSEAPTIGDNVALGAYSTLVGGIFIASGIAVGANSLVNKTFDEQNICIAGVPAKKISNNGSSTWGGRVIYKRVESLCVRGNESLLK